MVIFSGFTSPKQLNTTGILGSLKFTVRKRISSASPAGAISGVVQAGIILGSALFSYQACADAWGHGLDFLFRIPTAVWITFLFFGVMGYLLYAFVFGMVGALVSKTEDISKSSGTVSYTHLDVYKRQT